MHKNYKGEGVDQLDQVIQTLKKDPNSRRIVMTAWNPAGMSVFHVVVVVVSFFFFPFLFVHSKKIGG
jgi:hypothetical protein